MLVAWLYVRHICSPYGYMLAIWLYACQPVFGLLGVEDSAIFISVSRAAVYGCTGGTLHKNIQLGSGGEGGRERVVGDDVG